MVAHLEIAGRRIGAGEPAYLVAEMSANHGQDLGQALKIVEAAKAAGADAIKLQTYTADTLTLPCDTEPFRVSGGQIWDGRTLYDLYREAFTPWEWQPRLKEAAEALGLHCFSSPFDPTAVDFLEEMRVPAYKIASFEVVDTGLLQRVARTGKPVIMSTGMAYLGELEEALATLTKGGAAGVALLKCTSSYPAPPDEMNLRTIPNMAQAFGVPVGLSDHTLGIAVPIASIALGACIIEKHFTLSRDFPGPDSSFSLEPAEFKAMVEAVRVAERALGRVQYEPTPKELASRRYRRSLFVTRDVAAGETFSEANVRSVRPASGLHPRHLPQVLGARAARAIPAGTPMSWDLIVR